MPKFKYAKLVRDKIVDDQIASSAKPSFRQLNVEANEDNTWIDHYCKNPDRFPEIE